ncbi:hypothetical protein PsYK624_153380 [Phanerochaete sordida]|uniref:B30.2/SPRY domain-containing protein n=1 Tax=Phanerochaete sordida TaxID=48140 RepID=A0A9P3GT59_9APHY|nr:hypothetical protein PsYK624_153380 [Phanerochaete sordida]
MNSSPQANQARSRDFIKERNTPPEWGVSLQSTGSHDIAGTLEKNGVLYAHNPRRSDGLQYFEVTVNDLRGVHLGIGLFQLKPRAKDPLHSYMKSRKIWWSSGRYQSLKSTYGTHCVRKARAGYFIGDVIGCGIRSDTSTVFLTGNGAWQGDYAFNPKAETCLAVFLYLDTVDGSSLSRYFDIRISFDEGHAPFSAQACFRRMIDGHTRHSVQHAPLPPEVLSIITSTCMLTLEQDTQAHALCKHLHPPTTPVELSLASIARLLYQCL